MGQANIIIQYIRAADLEAEVSAHLWPRIDVC